MEKKLTINDVFYFVNQAIEHDANLRASEPGYANFWINCDGFDIFCMENNKTIVIRTYRLNEVKLDVTDMEIAQFRVLMEKVKEYSKNKAIDEFLNHFVKEEDNSEKTIDDIDD